MKQLSISNFCRFLRHSVRKRGGQLGNPHGAALDTSNEPKNFAGIGRLARVW